jgi:hypothetical protein
VAAGIDHTTGNDPYRMQAYKTAGQLTQVPSWRLSWEGLARLEVILARVQAAATAHDPVVMGAVRGDLALLATRRLTDIGAQTTVPPADLPLERINHLIHQLIDDGQAAPQPSADPLTGPDGATPHEPGDGHEAG